MKKSGQKPKRELQLFLELVVNFPSKKERPMPSSQKEGPEKGGEWLKEKGGPAHPPEEILSKGSEENVR